MRVESLGKRYGARQPWVIRDVTAEVAPGRLIRVEGRNGSGKSTLLRMIAGILTPSAGKVAGRPHTGYVPERFPPALRPMRGVEVLREDAGRLVVRADREVSDDVLRAMLATGTAHVLAVRDDTRER